MGRRRANAGAHLRPNPRFNVKSAELNRDHDVAHLLRNVAIHHIGNSRPKVDYVIDSIGAGSAEPHSGPESSFSANRTAANSWLQRSAAFSTGSPGSLARQLTFDAEGVAVNRRSQGCGRRLWGRNRRPAPGEGQGPE
jgi:hypothetical protein